MTLKALIFDVDGTLAETEEAHRHAFNATFVEEAMDWHWSQQDYGMLLRTTGGKERMRRHRDNIGASVPNDETITILHRKKTAHYATNVARGDLNLRSGVIELVANARKAGLKLAVATTTNRPNVDALCQACWGRAANKVFDVIAAGDEVANKKPAPDVFLLALERLGLTTKNAIAFEDSRNGVISAQQAGLRVVVTPSAYTENDDFNGAIWVIPDLTPESLPDLLRF